MRKIKLFTLLAGLFLATSMWADPVALDETSGLSYVCTATSDANGTLTITYDGVGTGIMPDYAKTSTNKSPWYDVRAHITWVSLPSGLTKIGNYAFYECNMIMVTIPATVTEIRSYAFQNDTSLLGVEIPASVTSIGRSAFHGCNKLASITLSEGLESVGQQAFQGCIAESITFPSSLTSVATKICQSCSELVSLTFLGETPCTIATQIFGSDVSYNCPNLEKIYVPDVDVYTAATDKGWSEYTSYLAVIPTAPTSGDFGDEGDNLHWAYSDNVLTITGSGSTGELDYTALPWDAYIFDIEVIHLPAEIASISGDAFWGMEAVTTIYLAADPEDLEWADDGDDFDMDNPPICYVPDEYKSAYISKFSGENGVNVTFKGESEEPGGGGGEEPEPVAANGLSWSYDAGVLTITYDGAGTGVMDDYSLSDKAPWHDDHHWDITSIVLPEGLTHIGAYAFLNLSGVTTTVTLPSTLTSIGAYAFSGCNITSIALPSGMTAVDDNAFNLCSKLASVTIPSSVTRIGANAFSGTKIASVTLPNAVTVIDEGAFGHNSVLSSITIPANVTEIGLSAFSYCTNLTSVTCSPTTAPTLGNNAFYNHHADLVITYPNGSDQDYANKFLQYYDCLRNASTSAQAPLPHLSGTFSGGTLTWDLSFTGTSGTLMEHDGTLAISGTGAMDDYDWTNNVWAPWFYYADFINHINIASGVTKIGESSFALMTNVNTFNIPASVTYIGGDAFMGCDNPEAIVYCYANPATLEWHDNVSAYEGVGWAPDDFLSLTRSPWGTYTWHVQATKCVVPSNYLEGYKAKWARGGDYRWWDLNVWFTSELQDGETAEYITNALNDLDGKTAPVVTLVRPFNRDGYFATLCLPFDMSAEQIAESSLHGAEIKEFTNATVDGGTLNIEFTEVDHIEAGKPYFVKYTDAELLGDALDRLDFMDVVIDKTAPVSVTHGGLTMTGTYVPKSVSVQTSATDGDGVLFLGANNQLFWPNVAGNIKPFRAYFSITGGGAGAPMRRGMPARIVEKEQTPTGIDNQMVNGKCQNGKYLENGMLIIEKNGVRYNAQGQIVK